MLEECWGKEKKGKEKEFNSATHTIIQINTVLVCVTWPVWMCDLRTASVSDTHYGKRSHCCD